MQNFPIMQMKTGDDVTVAIDAATIRGTVEMWTNDVAADGGFAVLVRLGGNDRRWFYVAKGAKFYR